MKAHWSRNLFQRIYATILRDRFRRRAVLRSQRRSRRRSSSRLSRRADWEPLEPRMLLAADVATDKFDYAPGSTAIISTFSDGGADHNFLVGETVRFQVVRTDGIADRAPGNLPWQVTDGVGGFAPHTDEAGRRIFPDTDGIADGRIATTWFVDPQYSNAGLQVTATGLVSGEQASAVFHDSAPTIIVNPYTVTYDGQPHAVTGSATSASPGSGSAIVLSTPAGLSNGDKFQFIYVTPTQTETTSTDIATYNTFVNASVNTGDATYLGQLVRWKALGSTDTVSALQNLGTNPYGIYQSNGTKVANSLDSSGLWSGSGDIIGATMDLAGGGAGRPIVSGTNPNSGGMYIGGNGGPNARHTLGNPTYQQIVGSAWDGNGGWLAGDFGGVLQPGYMYAVSEVLTVGPDLVPEDLSGLLHLPAPHTEPGTYIDTWTFDGNATYAATSGTVTNTILKATASITVNPYAVTYDGQSHAATGSATGVNVPLPGSGSAIVLSTPAGLSNGDKFQFIYVTPTQTETTSTDIATYNTFVNASVNTGDATYLGQLVRWKALGSTDTVSALQNLGTNPYGIYQSNGTKVANSLDSSGLWSGSGDIIGATMDLAGGGAGRPIVSGTDPNSGGMYIGGNGGPTARHTLGNPTYQQIVGSAWDGNGGWLAGDFGGVLQPGYMYAVSEVLTVGPPPRAPENLIGLLRLPAPRTAAGTYTDTWTFDGNDFYEPASGTVTSTIAKAAATISVTGYTVPADRQSHAATGTATGVLGETLAGLDLSATAHSAVGVYANDPWTFIDSTGNYENKTGTVSSEITKPILRAASISVVSSAVTYDGRSHGATGSATGAGGIDLAGLLRLPAAHTAAGTYIDTWTFDGNDFYEPASGTVTTTIAKATPTIIVTGYSGTYDGASHTATGTARGVLGETLAGLSLAATARTNAGTYTTDAWTFTDTTGNYENTTGTVTTTIAKAAPTISVTGYTGTYDGASHTATGTARGVLGETLAGLSLAATARTNAGTFTGDAWTFTDSTGNYENKSGTVTTTIAKAAPTISVTGYTGTYDGASHTATGSAKGVLGETLAGLDLAATARTNAGTSTTDVWTFTDSTGNYENKTGTVTTTIAKAAATISVTGYSGTYDGVSHTATGTARGVLGETLTGLSLAATARTNAGTSTTDAWTFTDTTGNYHNATGTVTTTIAKAAPTISVTGYTGTYDGASHTATGTAKGVLGETLAGLNLAATTRTNAGTSTTDAWTFTDATGNYNNATGTVTTTIAKAAPTISVTGYSGTYDGVSHTATGTAKGVLGETLAGLSLAATARSNAGTFTGDAWTFTDSTGNYENKTGTVTTTIAKAIPTISVTGYSGTYDGVSHTATGSAKGVLGETLAGLDLAATARTNAGTFTGDAWTFTDSTGNYENKSGTVTTRIAKAAATISVTGYTGTYDGVSHTATGTAKGVLGETLAGLDLAATARTNAGSASDPWTFTDSTGNYENASGAVTSSIAKAAATISVTGYTGTYDGQSHAAAGTATGVLGESLAGLDLSATARTSAGTSADPWTFTDNTGNYENSSGAVTSSIARAAPTISITGYTGTYDGQSHTAAGTATGVLGETLAGLDLFRTARTNAGTFSDPWSFTDSTGNYENKTGTLTTTIAKAAPTISVAGYSGTYDGVSHTATGTATGVLGETLAGLDLFSTARTNAGTFSDPWTFTDATGNYQNTSGTVTSSIARAVATISVTGYSGTFDGVSHTAMGIVTGVLGETLAGLDLFSTARTNAGSVSDPWTFTDSTGNYENASGVVTSSIAKAAATISVTGYSGTYDAQSHTATGNVTGVLGESLAGLDLSATARTNAGESTDPWTFTDSTGNYLNTNGTVTTTIAKAEPMISVTGYTGTYDGASHTATGAARGVLGEALAGLSLPTARTNAGTSTDAWTFTDPTGNYLDTAGTVTTTIAKAEPTISVTGYPVTYDGRSYTATGAARGVLGETLTGLSLSATARTNAGTFSDTWTFTDSTGNYLNTNGTVTTTIARAAPTISVTGYTGTYDGASHTATGTAKGVLGETLAGLSLSARARTNAGTSIDTWTFTDSTGNYLNTNGTVTTTIAKAEPTISVTGYSGTYDGVSHTATGTAKGVLGETLAGLNLAATARTNAGTSTRTWTFTDSTGNYRNTTGTVTTTIAKAEPTISVTGYSGTYDGVSHTATGTAKGVLGETLAGLILLATVHDDAGTFTDPWWFYDSTGNYLNTTGTVTTTIAKAEPTISVTGYSGTYDAQSHTATGNVTGVLGETLAGLDLFRTARTDAGTSTDTWTFTDSTGNYLDTTGTVTTTIAKAEPTISVTGYPVTYDGRSYTATGAARGVLGETLAGLSLSATSRTNAGTFSDTWTFTDSTGNYLNTNGTVTTTIARAAPTIRMTGYTGTYDGASHTATGTAKGVLGETLAGLSLSARAHTNAGTFSDTWTFTDSTGNYLNTDGTVTTTIAKAEPTISVTGYSGTYDGVSHTATGTAKGVLGETLAGLSLATTARTNAGTFMTDAWTFTDSTGNYHNATGTVTTTIAKAAPTISVTGYTGNYDGVSHTATGTAKGVLGETLAGLSLAATARTNAGTFTTDAWTFTDSTGNYENKTGTVTTTIAKATPTISVTGYSGTYDGVSHTATGTAKGVLGETLAGLSLSATARTNAGTSTTDAWTFTDSTGNYNNATGTVTTTIAKAAPTISVTGYSGTYDGVSHTATGTAKGVLGESLAGLSLAATARTNAGTFTTDAWTFTDSTGNYENKSGTVTTTIARAAPTISVTGYSGTYDGVSHSATGTAKGVLGESLAGLSLSATARTNAGTYTTDAWTYTDSTGNYNNATGTVTTTIAKAAATISVTGYSGTYDGVSHTATGNVTGVLGESLAGLDLSPTARTNAGTFTDPWTFTDSTGNYENKSGTVSSSIAKAAATISVTGYTGTYDGVSHTATGTAKGVLGETLAGLDLSPTARTNAGSVSDPWTFADATGNYESASGSVTSSIAKAAATISVTGYAGTYDAQSHTAAGTATGVLGESLAGLDLSSTARTNAGTFADPWSFTDSTGNYENSSGSVTSSIAKAAATISVTGYNGTYDGVSHAATGNATGVLGESLAGLDLSSTARTNAGTFADPWSFTDSTGNYENTSGTVTSSIARAAATISVTGYTGTYDGQSHTATGTATGVFGESLGGLSLAATARTNAGTFTNPWTFTDSTGNYQNTSGTVTMSIAKAAPTISVIGYTGTFDGVSHTASGTAKGVLGETLAGLDFSPTARTNAGTFTDPWTFTDSTGNYDNKTGTVTATIAKAAPTISVTGYSGTYDGVSHTATGTATGVLGETLSGLSVAATARTNAGTYTSDAWTFTDTTGNYENKTGTVTTTIAKANAIIAVTGYGLDYDGSSHTATGTANRQGGGEVLDTLLSLSSTTHTDVGTYQDTWTFAGNDNFSATSGSVTSVIRKATLDVDIGTIGRAATAKSITVRLNDAGTQLLAINNANGSTVASVAYPSSAGVNVTITGRDADTVILDLRKIGSRPVPKVAVVFNADSAGNTLTVLGTNISPTRAADGANGGTLSIDANTTIRYRKVGALTVASVATNAANPNLATVQIHTGGGLTASGDRFDAASGRLVSQGAGNPLLQAGGYELWAPASGDLPAVAYDIGSDAFQISGAAKLEVEVAGKSLYLPVTLGARGLVINGGQLTHADITFNGTDLASGLAIAGAHVSLKNLRVDQDVVPTAPVLTVTGSTIVSSIDGLTGNVTATLGSTASASAEATTGLVITAGEVTGLDMAVTSASLQLAGMTIDRTLLTLAATRDEKSLRVKGSGTMKGVTGLPSAVKVSLGNDAAAATSSTPVTRSTDGLLISGGAVTALDMAVMENTLTIDGTTFSNRGLKIAQDGSIYRMTGSAALTPTSESQILVQLKSSDGLVFSGTGATSTISAFKMIVPEAFSIGGLTITPTVTDSIDGLSFVETISSKTLVLSGKADVSATKFSGTINLGGNGTSGITVLNNAVTGIGMSVISLTAASHSFKATALSLTRSSGSGSASTFDMIGTSWLTSNARDWSTTFSADAADKRLVISGGSVTTLGMTVVPNTVSINGQSFRGTAETFTYKVTPSNGVGTLTGSATLKLNGVSLDVDLGVSDADGWTYTAGAPNRTMLRSTTAFTLGGMNFDSTDLEIEKHATKFGYWEVTGKARFGLGNGIFEEAIDVTIGTNKAGNGWIASQFDLSQMQFRIDTGFKIAGVGFTTDKTSGLTVQYSEAKAKQTYEITGGATANLGATTFKVLFATDRVEGKIPKWQIDTTTNTVTQSIKVPEAERLPGLTIVNGALRRLDVMASAEWSLAGVSIYARDLHFTYDSAKKRMTFSGVAAALIDGFDVSPLIVSYMSGGTAASMTKGLMIEFGDNGSPGIEMVGNDLRTLDVAVSGTFFTGGIFINAEALRFKWTKVEKTAPAKGFTETFSMSGSANVRLVTLDGAALVKLGTGGQATGLGVTFGYTDDTTKTTYPGLVVTNGKLDKLDMTVSSSFGIDIKTPIPIKAEFELQKMRFQWDRDFDTTTRGDQSRFNLTGSASVTIEVVKVGVQFGSDDGTTPGLTITNGKLEYFDMTVKGDIEYEGIKLPVGDIQLGAIFVAKTGTLSLWGKGQIGLSVPSELGGSSLLPNVSATIGGGSRATALAAIDDPDKNGFIVQGGKLKRLTFNVTGYAGGGFNGGEFDVSYRRAGTWDNVWHSQRIEFSGSANVNVGFGSANMYLGTKAVPGIVIEDGALKSFHAEGTVRSNLLISFEAYVSVDYRNGYMDVTGTAGLSVGLPIPKDYQALARNKDSVSVSLAQVSAVFHVNAKNPRSDDSYVKLKFRVFDDLPEINTTVRFGAVAKVEGEFSAWDDALKNAAKNAANAVENTATNAGNAVVKVGSSVGNAVGNAFKKIKLGPIDGGTVYYDPTGTSLTGAALPYDPAIHFHTTTSASGDFALGLPEGTTTGRLVMFGGKDTSTALANHLVLVAPLTSSVLSPFTMLQMGIVDGHSRDEATAAARVKAGLGLPDQLNVNTSFYLLVALTGVEPAAAVFASDVEITSLVSMTAASLNGLTNNAGTHPTRQSLGIHAFAALADLVDSAAESGVPLDLTSESTAQAMIAATATRAGIDLSSASRQSSSASAARVIAAIVAKVGAVSIPVSGDPVEMGAALKAMVKPQIVATGVASEQLAAVNAGTATAADVEASFTGVALDTLVAAQIVGNLDAPQVSFSDPVVVVGPDGSGTATFQVSVTGDPSPLLPISIGYATEDYTATVADGDYDAVSGTLQWTAGDASTKTVTVPVHAGATPSPRQLFKLTASSATNAVVLYNGIGEIEQAPVSTMTDLAVSTLEGTPRNTTVLKATVGRASATHVGYAGSVTFMDGDSILATVDVNTAGEATWSSSLLAVGEHSFSAVYSGVSTSGYDYLSSAATPITMLVGTPQTLSVTALADITWGASSTMQQVLASSSLGIPVAYAVTGPATIDADGLLEVTGPGHVVVTVSQPGDDYTLAATPVTVAFDVLRPKLTVRIDNQTATYGDDLSTLALSYSISGFLESDTESSLAGLPVLSIPQGALHAGSYAITATTATDSFYDFAYEPGTLTVAKASLVILVNDASVAYGAPIPTLTFAAEGFVNGETLAALASQPILTTAAAGSDAGDYAITASGFDAADYEITTIAGTLTITPVALEIRADDLAITYGDAPPTLTATFTGLVNGDTAASLAVAEKLTLSASSLHAGTYEVAVSDAADPNYTITFVPGTLTVAKAALSITAVNQTQVVGRSQPTLTALYSGFVNGETEGVLATKPQLTTDSDGSVGSAAITVFGAVSDDYAITYHAGVLSVVIDEPSFAILPTVASPLAGEAPTYSVVIVSAIDGEKVTSGTVQFRFDGVDVGSPVALDANGVASFTTDPLTAGSHTITAVYSGTAQIAGATQSLAVSVGAYGSTMGLVDPTPRRAMASGRPTRCG